MPEAQLKWNSISVRSHGRSFIRSWTETKLIPHRPLHSHHKITAVSYYQAVLKLPITYFMWCFTAEHLGKGDFGNYRWVWKSSSPVSWLKLS